MSYRHPKRKANERWVNGENGGVSGSIDEYGEEKGVVF